MSGPAGARRAAGPVPAYVLGGLEAGLAVIRSLGGAGIPVVCVWTAEAESARSSRYVQRAARSPHPRLQAQEYVEFLCGLEERIGSGLLIPTTDETLVAVSQAKEVLQRRHLLACPGWDVAERFVDKGVAAEFPEGLGVPVPRTVIPGSLAELEDLAPEQLSYPCVLKPRLSHLYVDEFGEKMTKVGSASELVRAWRRAEDAGIGVLVQEYIPGPESNGVNYNGYLVDGEPVLELTARKVRLRPPDLGFPSAVVSAWVPEIVRPARDLLRAIGLDGFANVEFKRDSRDGAFKLMEVNGRPNLSGLLSQRCGGDFPLMTYRHLVDGERPKSSGGEFRRGVYWVNEVTDLKGRRGEAGPPLRDLVRPYLRPRVFAWLSATDPAPFLARLVKAGRG